MIHWQIQEYLDAVKKNISNTEARTEVLRELESHIYETMAQENRAGTSEAASVKEVISRMGDPVEVGASLDKIHRSKLDFVLIFLVAVLVILGVMVLFPLGWGKLQLIWSLMGGVLTTSAIFMSYRGLKRTLRLILPVALLSLVIGHLFGRWNDNQLYLHFGAINIKIIELAGTLVAISIPSYFEIVNLRKRKLFLGLVGAGAVTYLFWCGALVAAIGCCFSIFVSASMLNESGRFRLWFTLSTGAFWSGMVFGTGGFEFLSQNQWRHALVDSAHTDFILNHFHSISKPLEIIVIGLSLAIGWRLFAGSRAIKNPLLANTSKVATFVFSSQVLIGTLTNLGLMPALTNGVGLPFLSYGGSMLIANFALIGVVLACLKRQSISIFE